MPGIAYPRLKFGEKEMGKAGGSQPITQGGLLLGWETQLERSRAWAAGRVARVAI